MVGRFAGTLTDTKEKQVGADPRWSGDGGGGTTNYQLPTTNWEKGTTNYRGEIGRGS